MLDEAGWTECTITVSNSLDEFIIQDLLLQGAQINTFGVGERLITARSEPVFGGVYKLVAYEDDQGNVIPKIKLSENVSKITTPQYKKVYRLYGGETGKAIGDWLCTYDEDVDSNRNPDAASPSSIPTPPGRRRPSTISWPSPSRCPSSWKQAGLPAAQAGGDPAVLQRPDGHPVG